MATIYIQDTFTEGADTELSLHTPDVGGAWSKHPSFATNATVVAAEDRVRGDSSTVDSLYINATTPGSADYEIAWTARQTTVGTGSRAGAVGRYNATTNNGYRLYYGGSEWTFGRVVSGTYTELATWNGSETVNTDYAIRWFMRGDLHEIYFDGVARIVVRDSTYLSAGRAGVFCRLNGRVDNFTVQSIDPAGSARVEQITARVVTTSNPAARFEQIVLRVVTSAPELSARVTQAKTRVLSAGDPAARVTQVKVRVLSPLAVPITPLDSTVGLAITAESGPLSFLTALTGEADLSIAGTGTLETLTATTADADLSITGTGGLNLGFDTDAQAALSINGSGVLTAGVNLAGQARIALSLSEAAVNTSSFFLVF